MSGELQKLEAVKMCLRKMELAEQVFEETKARAESTTHRISEIKVQSNSGMNWREDAILKMTKARECYIAATNNYAEAVSEVYEILDRLPEAKWIPVLAGRYLRYKTWEQIAIETRQSVRNCMTLHKKALKWLEENTGN